MKTSENPWFSNIFSLTFSGWFEQKTSFRHFLITYKNVRILRLIKENLVFAKKSNIKLACRVQICKEIFFQSSKEIGYSYIKNGIIRMYLYLYIKPIILGLFKIVTLNFTTLILTVLACFFKIHTIL